jgi:hypothetical protein
MTPQARVHRYRKRAADLRDIALSSKDRAYRDLLLISDMYDRLADYTEYGEHV